MPILLRGRSDGVGEAVKPFRPDLPLDPLYIPDNEVYFDIGRNCCLALPDRQQFRTAEPGDDSLMVAFTLTTKRRGHARAADPPNFRLPN